MRHLCRCCILAAVAALGGCDLPLGPEDNPPVLRDSTGVAFGWSCDDDRCWLDTSTTVMPMAPCRSGYSEGITHVWGRLYSICSSCISPDGKGSSWQSGNCRPIACSGTQNCPQIFWYTTTSEYECRSGLCQNVDTTTYPPDKLDHDLVTRLCFAKVPRDQTLEYDNIKTLQVNALVQKHCPRKGTTCVLPAECWQP